MNLVLTMAGKYTRFKLFGNKVPKYLLPLGAETILSIIIDQFLRSTPNVQLYLIANRHDQIFFPIVRSIMERHNIDISNIIYIDDTSSQLETALHASELLPLDLIDYAVAFANIDTVLRGRERFFQALEHCTPEGALLDTFQGDSNQYSYVRVEGETKVVDIADRNVISSCACSGLYGFGSFSYMANLAAGLLRVNGEANFTDLYKQYILLGNDVNAYHYNNLLHTIVLGTPEEYVINIHRFK